MSFQPVVPLSGYVGWKFLERTLVDQQTAFNESQPVARATDYFGENIGTIITAEDLVSDRRLLEVALGAFGLDEDIDNKFFIQKILEEGTSSDEALANKLADPRYADFSEAFGFGDGILPNTVLGNFAEDIVSRYEDKQFQQAVGDQDNDLRLVLNLEGGLSDILETTSSTDAQWYSVMGNTPLRNVFETALGLPSGIGSIDVERQLEIFKERSRAVLGSDQLTDFTESEQQEKLIRLFLVRAEAANFTASTGGSTALTLLQSVPSLY